MESTNSRFGVYGSLERDYGPAVPIGPVYFGVIIYLYIYECVERERRCELKPVWLQTTLTLTVIILLQYMFCNELCVLYDCVLLSTKPPVSPSGMSTSIHYTQTPKPFITFYLQTV